MLAEFRWVSVRSIEFPPPEHPTVSEIAQPRPPSQPMPLLLLDHVLRECVPARKSRSFPSANKWLFNRS